MSFNPRACIMPFVRRNRHNVARFLAVMIGGTLALYTSFPANAADRLDAYNVDQSYHELDDSHYDTDQSQHREDQSHHVVDQSHRDKSGDKHNDVALHTRDSRDVNKALPRVDNKHSVSDDHGGQVINPHPYKYVMSPRSVCPGPDADGSGGGGPLIVLFIHSGPRQYSRRTNIRATWGNKTYHQGDKLRYFFVLADSEDPKVERSIADEQHVYGDILKENYVDSYKNLSIKAVGALGWVLHNCADTPFVVKTDDDAFVNVFSLIAHLGDLARAGQTSGLLMCRVNVRMKVLRVGKWSVTEAEFPHSFYPPYCAGVAVVMTRDIAKALYDASFRTRYLWVDDAWLTGLVARTANITHRQIGKAYTLDKAIAEQRFHGDRWYETLFAHLGPIAMRELWDTVVTQAKGFSGFSSDVSNVQPGMLVRD